MENIRTKSFRQTKAAALLLLLTACIVWLAAGGSRGSWRYDFQNQLLAGAEEMYMPGLAYLNRAHSRGVQEWIREKALAWLPVVSYAEDHAVSSPALEDGETLARILDAQANDENAVDETEIL